MNNNIVYVSLDWSMLLSARVIAFKLCDGDASKWKEYNWNSINSSFIPFSGLSSHRQVFKARHNKKSALCSAQSRLLSSVSVYFFQLRFISLRLLLNGSSEKGPSRYKCAYKKKSNQAVSFGMFFFRLKDLSLKNGTWNFCEESVWRPLVDPASWRVSSCTSDADDAPGGNSTAASRNRRSLENIFDALLFITAVDEPQRKTNQYKTLAALALYNMHVL